MRKAAAAAVVGSVFAFTAAVHAFALFDLEGITYHGPAWSETDPAGHELIFSGLVGIDGINDLYAP